MSGFPTPPAGRTVNGKIIPNEPSLRCTKCERFAKLICTCHKSLLQELPAWKLDLCEDCSNNPQSNTQSHKCTNWACQSLGCNCGGSSSDNSSRSGGSSSGNSSRSGGSFYGSNMCPYGQHSAKHGYTRCIHCLNAGAIIGMGGVRVHVPNILQVQHCVCAKCFAPKQIGTSCWNCLR